jgi:hypothetical protein
MWFIWKDFDWSGWAFSDTLALVALVVIIAAAACYSNEY